VTMTLVRAGERLKEWASMNESKARNKLGRHQAAVVFS
jgi:hypothetical protein